MRVKTVWQLLQETFKEWSQDNASEKAAALAYYTIFSIAPLLIIAIAIAGAVFGEEAARGEIVGQIKGLVGREGALAIETAIENANRPDSGAGFASLISVAVLLLGASGVFVQLQNALNAIWNIDKPPEGVEGFVRKQATSFAVVLSAGFLLLVSLVISAVLSGISNYASSVLAGFDVLWHIVNLVISFAVTTVLFALIFKYLPHVKIAWSDVWIGALLTAVLFTIGKSLISLYLGSSSVGSTYGAAGSLVTLLAWIYYSVQILFFGAEFTQVYARRYGSHRRREREPAQLSSGF